jgi:hypothetical protein
MDEERAEVIMRRGVPSKYRNVRTEVDGITFDSKKEATRYGVLRLMEAGGFIRNLRLQVPYAIKVNGVKVCTYKADFVYEEKFHNGWKEIVEDTKGVMTPVYRLKKKLMRAALGIEIQDWR